MSRAKEDIRSYLVGVGRQIGATFYFVGGCVRDELLGRECSDYDIVATGISFERLLDELSLFGVTYATGEKFPVLRHRSVGTGLPELEIALPRSEKLVDGEWEFEEGATIEEDLQRRDFSINSMAQSMAGELIDPFGGAYDVKFRLLRSLYRKSMSDDPLRILRGLRFVSQLGCIANGDLVTDMESAVERLNDVRAERFEKELLGILSGPHVVQALQLAQRVGVFRVLLPEIEAMVGCEQNQHHDYDVFGHTIRVVEKTCTDDPYVKLAALLHDVGKPPTRWTSTLGGTHFYRKDSTREYATWPKIEGAHEEIGAEIAAAICQRLRINSLQSARVEKLVREHMFSPNSHTPRTARRLIARMVDMPGDLEENIEALFDLRYGDTLGGKADVDEHGEEMSKNQRLHAAVLDELAANNALSVRDLALNGHDFMDLGLHGSDIGEMQRRLLALVTDHPELNNREMLIDITAAFRD